MYTWTGHMTALNKLFQLIASNFSRFFTSKLNPFYYMGALTIFLLIIASVSGIYLLLVYKIDPRYSYESVEALSNTFLGNLMRGLHRYTSDALMVTAIGHAGHVILTDRFRSFRWIAWVSGVATILLFITIGVSGYILIWDERAQLVMLLTAKFLTYLPVFGHALMSTILASDIKALGGMFRVLLFGHIALTIAIVITLWVHVLRISRPKLMPPRFLYVTVGIGFVLLSIFFPAASDKAANISKIPLGMTMDWFYLFGYPALKVIPISYYWPISIGIFIFLTVLPWIISRKRNPQASIDLDKCVGCEQCYIDCPYRAINMRYYDDKKKAILDQNKCSGCGSCVGSCNALATGIPSFNIYDILEEVDKKKPEIVTIRCGYTAKAPAMEGMLSFDAPCVSVMNPRYAEMLFDKGVKGLFMVSCETRDCHFREGNIWNDERYQGLRVPKLKKKTDPSRIRILHAPYYKDITKDIEEFRDDLNQEVTEGKVMIKTPGKLNYAIASLLLIVPLIGYYIFTTQRIEYYPHDKSIVAMSFKYRSSTVKQTLAMQADPDAYKGDRSPVDIEIFMDGQSIYTGKFYPRGLRGDASVFVYDEILLDPKTADITVKLSESAYPEKITELTLSHQEFKAKDTLYIYYDDLNGKLLAM